MKKIYLNSTQKYAILLMCAVFLSTPSASLIKNSTFTSFFWTQNKNDSIKNGCYGYTKIESVATGGNRYFSTFWLHKYSWWHTLFTDSYIKTTITSINGQPSAIIKASAPFSKVEWFTGFERNNSKDTLSFYFPLLPQSSEYGRYDFFTVNVNDTVKLEFCCTGDSTMLGSFVHKQPTSDGTINILARNAFIVELTRANPLRIKSIRCNGTYLSLLNTYLKYNLDTFKKNAAWYGIDITDTTHNVPQIAIQDIAVTGTSPLIAGSSQQITWKLGSPSDVDSCIISLSFDNKKTWNQIAKTGSDSSYTWKIPDSKSDSTYIQITAFGTHGETISAVSMNTFSIIDSSTIMNGLAIHSIKIEGTSPFIAGSFHALSWTLESPAHVDSCLIYASFDNQRTWFRTGKTGSDSSFIWTVPAQESDSAYIRITAWGLQGINISSYSHQFSTILPMNFILTVQSYAENTIVLKWNPESITIPGKMGLCIAYRSGDIVKDINDNNIDTLMYDFNTSTDTISDGLDKSGTYYFTAFVVDSSYAFTIANGIAIDSAVARDLTPPDNKFNLSGKTIDSESVLLSWKNNDEIEHDIDSLGIWYNKFNVPAHAYDPNSSAVCILQGTTNSDSIIVSGLDADQQYYFALFIADHHGNWSTAPATAQVKLRTKTVNGKSNGTKVIVNGNDKQSIFNDSLQIWSDELTDDFIDTVDLWTSPVSDDLLVSGPSFSFRNGKTPQGTSISISLKYNIPDASYDENDIRVYRYNTNTGTWRIESSNLSYDTDEHTISFSSDNLQYPIALMIDTSTPEIEGIQEDSSTYPVNTTITNMFTVRDNIENPKIFLLAAPGESGYTDISQYISSGENSGDYIATIPAYMANNQSGLRCLIIVSDGRNNDTINVSRKILRDNTNSDNLTIPAMQWTPLTVTAHPEQNFLSKILAQARNVDNFKYNNHEIRLIQWLPNTENKYTQDKWVEFSDSTDDDFVIAPGKLFWIKTKSELPIIYGKAVIPALIDTFEITLQKENWTEFGIPYNFNIYSGDIVQATGKTNTIELYEWVKTDQTYSTKAVYLPGIDAASDPKTMVRAASAYTAYNDGDENVILRIPPLCTQLSTLNVPENLGKKNIVAATSRQWSVKLTFHDSRGTELSPIYCAAQPENQEPRFYKAAPTFTPFSVNVVDTKTGKQYGHAANGDLSDGGEAYLLSYENQSDETTIITTNIEKISGLPSDMEVQLFKNDSKNSLSYPLSTHLFLSSHQKSTGYLIIGSNSFIENFVNNCNTVFSCTPFTYHQMLKIIYRLPIGVQHVEISLYNLNGQRIEYLVKQTTLNTGEGSFLIPNKYSSGYYLVRMRAVFNDNRESLTINKRWMNIQ